MIAVEGIYKVGERLFLEVSSKGSLPVMKRGVPHRPSILTVKFNIGLSPGQEGIALRIRRQTQDFWSQQK